MTSYRAVRSSRRLGLALLGAPLLLLSACSGGAAENASAEGAGEPEVGASITPEDGASEVAPDAPITVQAENGTLTEVAVDQQPTGDAEAAAERDEGDMELDALTGTFNDDNSEWVSDWTMNPGNAVTVTATVESEDGETTDVVAEFTTLEAVPGQRLELESNMPSSGQTVGVGMPLILNFDLPVQNKEQVTAALEVTSDQPAEGAWTWTDDDTVMFRPSEYWAPNQQVTVDMHLAGVRAAEDVYGLTNYRMEFEVGREQITRASNDSHRMLVERDGEQIKDFPVSMGDGSQPEYRTTSGNHVIMELHQDYVMDSSTVNIPEGSSDSYRLEVAYALRLTNSGIFAHHSPGNGSLGQSNISHGCVNMSLEDSRWFYENSLVGDPYEIEGSTRELEPTNGWGMWQVDWETWLADSPFDEPEVTDEPGSPGSPFTEE